MLVCFAPIETLAETKIETVSISKAKDFFNKGGNGKETIGWFEKKNPASRATLQGVWLNGRGSATVAFCDIMVQWNRG